MEPTKAQMENEYAKRTMSDMRDASIKSLLSPDQWKRFERWYKKRRITRQKAFAEIIEAGMESMDI